MGTISCGISRFLKNSPFYVQKKGLLIDRNRQKKAESTLLIISRIKGYLYDSVTNQKLQPKHDSP